MKTLSAVCFVLLVLQSQFASFARASCTLSSSSSLSELSTIKKSCTSIAIRDFTVPAGQTLDLTNLLQGTTVNFHGTIKFGYSEWEGPLIKVSGTDITVQGADGHVLDGEGYNYWDGLGGNGGKTKPKFFQITSTTNGVVKRLNIQNTPKHCMSITSNTNITIRDIVIDNRLGQSQGGHNTDGFNVNNVNYLTIRNSYVYNQDDCLAVNSGTNINFLHNYCWGGHGISIGSVGGRSNNVVDTVLVKNCTLENVINAVRIKTVAGATGSVNGVTYQDITIKNATKYAITIRGDYTNSGSTGTPTTGVPITKLTLKNISGTVSLSSGYRVYVSVASDASNWSWSSISLSGGRSSNYCSGQPSSINCSNY